MDTIDWQNYLEVVAVTGAWLGVIVLAVLLKKSIRYSVGPRHVKVKILWFLPVRRVRLDNLRYIATNSPHWAERWTNLIFLRRDRILHLRKRRGLFRSLVISPEKRILFKAEIERARETLGLPPLPEPRAYLASPHGGAAPAHSGGGDIPHA